MFKCKCGKEFKDFRNGGYIKNLEVHCPDCVGKETFTINVNGIITHTTFDNAMTALRGLK